MHIPNVSHMYMQIPYKCMSDVCLRGVTCMFTRTYVRLRMAACMLECLPTCQNAFVGAL